MSTGTEWSDAVAAMRDLSARHPAHWENYLGFYSSWLGGYFREPWAMLLPVDDHGFHRGDGVFEAVRLHDRAFFDLGGHLQRLEKSAASLGMELPGGQGGIGAICVNLARLCNSPSGILRLYVTRGPGSFSPNPHEVVGQQIYAVITKIKRPDPAFYESGARAMLSQVPAKDSFWSQIKSCNYLQNVLMKKESVERGFDFSICVNERGLLCEGATENMLLITQEGRLIVPRFDYTLRGTTVRVVMKLAAKLVQSGELKSVDFGDVHADDLKAAKEAAFVGTTMGVLSVREIDGHKIGTGKAGPICLKLNQALMEVMSSDASLRTEF